MWAKTVCGKAAVAYAAKWKVPAHAVVMSLMFFMAMVWVVCFVVLALLDSTRSAQNASTVSTLCNTIAFQIELQLQEVSQIVTAVNWFAQGAIAEAIASGNDTSHLSYFARRYAPRLMNSIGVSWLLGIVLAYSDVASQVYPLSLNSSRVVPLGASFFPGLTHGMFDADDAIVDWTTWNGYASIDAYDAAHPFPQYLIFVSPVSYNASATWGLAAGALDASLFFETIHESAQSQNLYFRLSRVVSSDVTDLYFDSSIGDGPENQFDQASASFSHLINSTSAALDLSLLCWLPKSERYIRPLSIALVLCVPVAAGVLMLLTPFVYDMFVTPWVEKRRRLGTAPTKGPLAIALVGISGFDIIWRHQPRLVPSMLATFESRLAVIAKRNDGFVTPVANRRACMIVCRDPLSLVRTCKQIIEDFYTNPMVVTLFTVGNGSNVSGTHVVPADLSGVSGAGSSGGQSRKPATDSSTHRTQTSSAAEAPLSVMTLLHWCSDVRAKWHSGKVVYEGEDAVLLARLFQYGRPSSIIITQPLASRLPTSSTTDPTRNPPQGSLFATTSNAGNSEFMVEEFLQCKLRTAGTAAGVRTSTPHQLYSVTFAGNEVVVKPSLILSPPLAAPGIHPSTQYNPLSTAALGSGPTTALQLMGNHFVSDGEQGGARSGSSRRNRRLSALSSGDYLLSGGVGDTGSGSGKENDNGTRMSLNDILRPVIPQPLLELFEDIYTSLTTFSIGAVPFADVRHICFHHYRALKLLCHPFAPAERHSLQRRLLIAFGVPESNFFEQLAVRCTLRYVQKKQEELTSNSVGKTEIVDEDDSSSSSSVE